jgi:hypothetical protein
MPRPLETPAPDGRIASLQARFAAAMLDPEATPPPGIGGSATARLSRFEVYRNNVMAGLVRCLETRFPVVTRLVGTEFFRATARIYVGRQPPSGPALIDYGGGFPAFLAEFEPASELPYLAAVAKLEWFRFESCHAADERSADAADLAELADANPDELYVRLHASVRFLQSPFPVVSIWETNTLDREVRPIGPELGGEQTLIVRQGLQVRLIHLDAGTYAFAAAISTGATISSAAECAVAADSRVSIPHALARLISAGAVRDITPSLASNHDEN